MLSRMSVDFRKRRPSPLWCLPVFGRDRQASKDAAEPGLPPVVSLKQYESASAAPAGIATRKIAKMDDELFKALMEPRSTEDSNFWMKVGMTVLLLGAVGSVGTFARISRVAHGSGIRGTALMRLNNEIGLNPAVALARAQEAAVLTDRVKELRSRLQDRHPLWYPDQDERK